MNIDTQGRGIFSDESRIEKVSKRAYENSGEATMSDAQSLQKQLDSCRDFCIGIDGWIKFNQKSISDLHTAIQEAIASNTLADFRVAMNQHWKIFDGFTQESILLLNKQKKGFQTQAKAIIAEQQALGQKSQLNNHVSNGFVDNLKNKL